MSSHHPATNREAHAFDDFCLLGVARSLLNLVNKYKEMAARGEPVPTTNYSTLKHWSTERRWAGRARVYDQEQMRLKHERIEKERAEDIKKRRDSRALIYTALRGRVVSAINMIKPEELHDNLPLLIRTLEYIDRGERLDAGEADHRYALGIGEGGGPTDPPEDPLAKYRHLTPSKKSALLGILAEVQRIQDQGPDLDT